MRALLLLVPALVFGDNYPRQLGIDAQHYTFRVTLADNSNEIQGQSTARIRFVQDGVTQLWLDLALGMKVSEVTSRGAQLRYTHADARLALALSAPPKAGETREFSVSYRGAPATGLHIVNNKFGERCFFSWNWPVLAHQWLPVIDHPSDKATSEFLVTAPARYQVVANGLLVET